MFTVQKTKNAHAGNIPESAWGDVSNHRTAERAHEVAARLSVSASHDGGWHFNVRVVDVAGVEVLEPDEVRLAREFERTHNYN